MRLPSFAWDTTDVLSSHIKPFDFTITLRTPDAEYLVESVYIEHPPKEPSKL